MIAGIMGGEDRWYFRCGACLAALLGAGCAAPRQADHRQVIETGLESYYRTQAKVEPMVTGRPQFFDSGPAIKSAMLEMIREAQDYILVDNFLLNDGPEARPVYDALAAKRRQGVRVFLIGDSSSRFVPEANAFESLKTEGIPVAEFNPFAPARLALLPRLLERDHRKFWIVDGHSVMLGGANLSELSLTPPESGGNRDLMVRLSSPEAVRQMVISFVETWNSCPEVAPLDASAFAVPESPATGGFRFWLFNQGSAQEDGEITAVMMEGLFGSARREVWLIQPYTFVYPVILDHIRQMNRRGVAVNVVLSNQARAPRFRLASFYGIKDLIRAGAVVWIYNSEVSPLHYKIAVVDDRLAYVGSANLNYRSLKLARELNAVFEDRASLAEVQKVVESVRGDTRPVSEDEARRYRGPRYFLWWLLMQVGG